MVRVPTTDRRRLTDGSCCRYVPTSNDTSDQSSSEFVQVSTLVVCIGTTQARQSKNHPSQNREVASIQQRTTAEYVVSCFTPPLTASVRQGENTSGQSFHFRFTPKNKSRKIHEVWRGTTGMKHTGEDVKAGYEVHLQPRHTIHTIHMTHLA